MVKKQQVVEAIARYEYDVPNSAAAVCCLLLDSMKPALNLDERAIRVHTWLVGGTPEWWQ